MTLFRKYGEKNNPSTVDTEEATNLLDRDIKVNWPLRLDFRFLGPPNNFCVFPAFDGLLFSISRFYGFFQAHQYSYRGYMSGSGCVVMCNLQTASEKMIFLLGSRVFRGYRREKPSEGVMPAPCTRFCPSFQRFGSQYRYRYDFWPEVYARWPTNAGNIRPPSHEID